MKTVKRIIAVLTIIFVAAVVGYLAYTGSRLTAQMEASYAQEATL